MSRQTNFGLPILNEQDLPLGKGQVYWMGIFLRCGMLEQLHCKLVSVQDVPRCAHRKLDSKKSPSEKHLITRLDSVYCSFEYVLQAGFHDMRPAFRDYQLASGDFLLAIGQP